MRRRRFSRHSERPEQLERGILPDLHHVTFVGDGVGGEGGLLEEAP